MLDKDKESLAYGVVAIGRNEGERLKRCLRSANGAKWLVYVNSGSTDDSVAWAKSQGIDVVELDERCGFTAARARNAGFRRLVELEPELAFVQFVDGDCQLFPSWPTRALEFLHDRPQVCAAFGRRREQHPERSIYNRICDAEWDVPIGEARACGGDVMMRTAALAGVGGYRADLIAGEEPELCTRLREDGWSIWRIDGEMTLHDAAILRFGQWWRRNVRSGYAFALGCSLHGAPPERLWVWESRRAWIWGLGIPMVAGMSAIAFGPAGFSVLLLYPIQWIRRIPKQKAAANDQASFALFELLGRFAEVAGQVRFLLTLIDRRRRAIIEYK